jgi:prephenate dehydrogenase
MIAFSRIAVLGCGLMGSSLLGALQKECFSGELCAWSPDLTELAKAKNKFSLSLASNDIKSVVENADLIVLCVPIAAMEEVITNVALFVKNEAIVTDVASLKSPIDHQASIYLKNKTQWLGSHPMTGSEESGIDAARPDLYENATVVLTPTNATPPEILQKIQNFWEALHCRIVIMSPEEHDEAFAVVSQLPYFTASLVAACVPEKYLEIVGPGFRDTTRLAKCNPELWIDVFLNNQNNLEKYLSLFIQEAEQLLESVQNSDRAKILDLLKQARHVRIKV